MSTAGDRWVRCGNAVWTPECWCTATLKLCESFIVDEGECDVRYPEQWAYFLWRPMNITLPYMRPDCYGLTCGSPTKMIVENTESAPLYAVQDHECDWVNLLDIILVCSDLQPWLRDFVVQWQNRKQRESRARFVALYGSESAEFQHFVKGLMGVEARDASAGKSP